MLQSTCQPYIEDCICSILKQTYNNFELIVIDDCSTDNSYEKAKKFEEKDNRVKVVRLDKNYGIGRAKNEGIIRSKGDYIVTLDADDIILPEKPVSLMEDFDLKGSLKQVTSRVVKGVEKIKIANVLKEEGHNKTKAAANLQVSYKTLLEKIKEYGISEET